MGKASRAKREAREELPERLRFGPEFLKREPEVIIQAGLATATSGVTGVTDPIEEAPDGLG
jgi:hypothetical protein